MTVQQHWSTPPPSGFLFMGAGLCALSLLPFLLAITSTIPVLATVMFLVVFTLGIRVLRIGVVASDDFLVIRNLLVSHRVKWEDIASVDFVETRRPLGLTGFKEANWAGEVTTVEGRHIVMAATSTLEQGSGRNLGRDQDEAKDLTHQVLAQWRQRVRFAA